MRSNTQHPVALHALKLASVLFAGLTLPILPTLAADDSAQLALGKELFMQGVVPSCAVCHTLQAAGAEGAVDADHACFVGHRRLLLDRETRQHAADVVGIAAAAAGQVDGLGDAHRVLRAEQPPKHGVEAQRRVEQLLGAQRFGERADVEPFGHVVADVEAFAAAYRALARRAA